MLTSRLKILSKALKELFNIMGNRLLWFLFYHYHICKPNRKLQPGNGWLTLEKRLEAKGKR